MAETICRLVRVHRHVFHGLSGEQKGDKESSTVSRYRPDRKRGIASPGWCMSGLPSVIAHVRPAAIGRVAYQKKKSKRKEQQFENNATADRARAHDGEQSSAMAQRN